MRLSCKYHMLLNYMDLPAKLVFIDFETTGLDYRKDKIIEIGIAVYENMELVDTYSHLINPGIKINPEATKVNGITDDMVVNKPLMEDVIPVVFKMIKDQVIVGYNVSFDISFLLPEIVKNKLELTELWAFDVLGLVKETFPNKELKNRKLSTVKAYFEIKTAAHRALSDCLATFEVFKKCRIIRENLELEVKEAQAARLA